jgi:hypothetical protein
MSQMNQSQDAGTSIIGERQGVAAAMQYMQAAARNAVNWRIQVTE